MLNAKDALGLQEDLAIINARRQGSSQQEHYPRPDESGNAFGALAIALRARDNTNEKLRQQLDAKASERNEVAAMSRAARETVEDLARHVAKLTNTSPDAAVRDAHRILSRRFDAQLEGAIARKSVLRDIRQDAEEIKQLEWYIPAP